MKFYRLKYGQKLHAFEDEIGSVPIIGKTLDQYQKTYIHNLGGELIDVGSANEISEKSAYYIFNENLFFSKRFLEKVVAQKSIKSLQFCLAKNEFNERYCLTHPQDSDEYHILDFKLVVPNSEISLHEIEQEVHEHYNYLPSQIVKDRKYAMHQSETFAAHIISPFHLLMVNLAMNLSRTVRIQDKIPKALRNKFGKYNTKWFYKGLKRMNVIGKNCQIHPTALIEGSIIGDNTTIGANSIVRLSHLESDCYVSENVSVINSVLGKRTCIANSNYVNSILCYEEVFLIHGPYQLSIFGENSACFAVINCDIRLDQNNIKIPTSEGILDSAQPLLGIAYGHRSKTGGGNIIAAGRIVPNDLNINPPENIILGFDKK